MLYTILPTINLILLLTVIIGIPYFMITVVRLLKKIENRLENVESTMMKKNINDWLFLHIDFKFGIILKQVGDYFKKIIELRSKNTIELRLKIKMKEETQMRKLSFRQLSILIAIPVLVIFVVSGNGKFDWDKLISKIEKYIK